MIVGEGGGKSEWFIPAGLPPRAFMRGREKGKWLFWGTDVGYVGGQNASSENNLDLIVSMFPLPVSTIYIFRLFSLHLSDNCEGRILFPYHSLKGDLYVSMRTFYTRVVRGPW